MDPMSSYLLLTFAYVTHTFSLPTGLLLAVCHVESGHNVTAYRPNDGGTSSIGICQLKLDTARNLGFEGTEHELKDPSINVYYAGMYLRSRLDVYRGDIVKAVSAYNAGRFRVKPDGRIANAGYVAKVFTAWDQFIPKIED